MFNKIKLQDGVNLYIRKTEQFKTVNVTIKWKAPLEQSAASERTVLANVLEESNEKYPTQIAMRKALDELYGTVLYTDVSKRSSQHIVSLFAECVNDEFLQVKTFLNSFSNLSVRSFLSQKLQKVLLIKRL